MSGRPPKSTNPPPVTAPTIADRAAKPFVIYRETLLLVEGKSCEIFSGSLLQHLGRSDIQVRDFGGVTNLRRFLGALASVPGFERVRACGILRDAEDSALNARRSVLDALKAAKFKVFGNAPRFKVFILPDNRNPGMLETLCWQSVQSDPFVPCVDALLQCAATKRIEVRNSDKARSCAFLSIRPDYTGQVGRAAQQGHWPWDSAVFAPLKKFLVSL